MNVCTYNFNPAVGKYSIPVIGYSGVQRLIPFNNTSKKGWCPFHKRWEVVTVNGGGYVFACGNPVPATLGLDKQWNNNSFSLYLDKDNLMLTLAERFSWIDVHDGEPYQTNKVNLLIFDICGGKTYTLKNCKLKRIPDELREKIGRVLSSMVEPLFGKALDVGEYDLKDFLKFPTCPNFSRLAPFVDDVQNYQFRKDMNLFKDFCAVMHIRETKSLRKDFSKDPLSILFHAMAQAINFTDANAIKIFVGDAGIRNLLAKRLRFSIVRKSVYLNGTFYELRGHGNFRFNMIDGLRLWVQNALTNKSETVVMKRLIRFLKDTDFDVVKDAVSVYDNNARNLPVAFHERILKEGFTSQMHDQLMRFFDVGDDFAGGYTRNEARVVNKKIEYSPEILRFEDIFRVDSDGFSFDTISSEDMRLNRLMMDEAQKKSGNAEKVARIVLADSGLDASRERSELTSDDDNAPVFDTPDLNQKLVQPEINPKFTIGSELRKRGTVNDMYFVLPRDTDEMYDISANMRNCVGYLYRDKVLEGSAVIVVMIAKNKLVACFEIRRNSKTYVYEIVQAKGPGNRNVKKCYMGVITEWMNRKNLKSACVMF